MGAAVEAGRTRSSGLLLLLVEVVAAMVALSISQSSYLIDIIVITLVILIGIVNSSLMNNHKQKYNVTTYKMTRYQSYLSIWCRVAASQAPRPPQWYAPPPPSHASRSSKQSYVIRVTGVTAPPS